MHIDCLQNFILLFICVCVCMCVCVFVCVCECVCVCVCAFILFHLLVSSDCKTSVTYIHVRINDLLLCVLLMASAKFLHLHFRIYHISLPKTKLLPAKKLERKTISYTGSTKRLVKSRK